MSMNKSEYDLRYQRQKMKQIKFALNRETDKDIIQHLQQQPNVRQYLIGLIKQDLQKHAAK